MYPLHITIFPQSRWNIIGNTNIKIYLNIVEQTKHGDTSSWLGFIDIHINNIKVKKSYKANIWLEKKNNITDINMLSQCTLLKLNTNLERQLFHYVHLHMANLC